MDDNDNKPRGILSFVLADTGEAWAEMRCLGWDVVDAQDEAEDLSPEFTAHFIVPDSDRLH